LLAFAELPSYDTTLKDGTG